MQLKRYYFFDLDGTLADTDRDIRLAWKSALMALGLENPDFDTKFVAGPPLEEMLQTLFPTQYTDALGAAARQEFGKVYDSSGFPNTPEYPGVLDRVRALKAADAHVYIVTNKRWCGATAMAAKFGWMDVFEGLYTGDMDVEAGLEIEKFGCFDVEGTSKHPNIQTSKRPNAKLRKPELLARVIAELGAAKDECVMVGDTRNDFEAARKNGIEAVAVAWGYGKPEELAMADRVVRCPEEI